MTSLPNAETIPYDAELKESTLEHTQSDPRNDAAQASLSKSDRRIGYVIPEFPGQTHIFYWREIAELERLGVSVKTFSTRLPDRSIQSHDWTEQAIARTIYLRNVSLRDCWTGLINLPVLLQEDIRKSLFRSGLRGIADAVLSLPLAAKLASECHRLNITHAHAHSCGRTALICALANRTHGLPYSLTLHGPAQDYGSLQDLKWRRAKFATVITEKLLKEVTDELGDDLPTAIAVQGMGVDPDKLKRPTPYKPYNGNGPLRIFCCGRLHPAKGHQQLIDAAKELRDRGTDLEVYIAGQDEDQGNGFKKALDQQILDLGLQDVVHLLGAIDEQHVKEHLLQAHMFVLASHSEPLGVAYMEAMSCEVPVIGTNAGGVPELIEHGRDGLLVPPHDPQLLADAIENLLKDPERAALLAQAGRQRIETKFSSAAGARTLADLAFS